MIVNVEVEYCGNDDFRLADGRSADALNPKELLLYATACCAGKTVAGIMSKQRIEPRKFTIKLYGDMDTAEVTAQSTYTAFRIVYNVECASEVDKVKAYETVKLADEKYCGMLKMIRRIAPVRTEIDINMTASATI